MRISIALGALLFALNLSAQSALINEINYAATDPTGRGVEVVAAAGSDLTGWSLAIYTAAGLVQEVIDLSDAVIPNQQNGYGTVWYEVVQNDGGNGAALIDPTGLPADFVSYGTALAVTALDGPAAGASADYIGSSLLGGSLTLVGQGFGLGDFSWAPALLSSPGQINTDQLFMVLMGKQLATQTLSARSVPNPFIDQFTTYFDRPLRQRATLTVYDLRGVQIHQTQLVPGQTEAQVRLGSVPAGTYVLRFHSGGEQWTQMLRR